MKKYSKRPPLKYPGGKSRLAKKIISEMPKHRTYVEPFAGAAHVLYRKKESDKEILNDLNKELMKFYKDIKNKNICCKLGISSSKEYKKLENKKNKNPCDYIKLNKSSWGGSATGYGPGSAKRKGEMCFDSSRLENVILESKDYRKIINKYDSKDTLFYVDPPYVKANENECLYGKDMCNVNPSEVAKTLKNIKGKAIVSYDNHPSVKKSFKNWNCKNVKFSYSMAKKNKATELLCKNYD